MHRLSFAVVPLVVLVAGLSVAAEKPKVVVMSVSTTDATLQSLAQSVTEQVMTELGTGARIEVVGSSDLAAMLGLERQKQLMGCGETNCLAELSAAMGAPWLVLGTLGRADKVLRIDLKLIRASDGQAMWRGGKVISDTGALFNEVTVLGQQLRAVLLGEQAPVAKANAAPWVLVGAGVALATAGGIVAGAAAAPAGANFRWTKPITTDQVKAEEATGNALFAGGLVGAAVGVGCIAAGLAWALSSPKDTTVALVPAGNAVFIVGSF